MNNEIMKREIIIIMWNKMKNENNENNVMR